MRQVDLDFADERRSYTKAFERYALELSLMTTIQAAAVHLKVSGDVVKDIQKRYYQREFGKPDLRGLRWLAIDEICIGSGHRYLTVVMDLESGAVVFVGEGKSANALLPFWRRLKRPENLDASKDERKRLDEALKINQPLAMAYYMKEDLRRFWSPKDKAAAQAFLRDWLCQAWSSGVKMLKKMANTIAGKRSGLLAYYDHKISSGKLEGFNNKMKTMQRQAYGYRDQEFFKVKIFALQKVKYALVG